MNITKFGNEKLKTVLRSRRGSASIEYALIACMIAIAGAVGIAPYGSALAQTFSALSLDHLVGFEPAGTAHGCPRVQWSEAELKHLASKAGAKP